MADSTFTDHDQVFKGLLTNFFADFIQKFVPKIAPYLDEETLDKLDNEIFTDPIEGQRYETDVIMQSRFKDGPKDKYFLVHVEHQSYNQSTFGRRMLIYYTQLMVKYPDKDIYPVALFSYDTPHRAEPSAFNVDFMGISVINFFYDVVQLNRLDWKNYVKQPSPITSALMAKMNIKPQDRPRVKLACIKMMLGLKLTAAQNYQIAGFIDLYLRLNAEEQKEFEEKAAKDLPARQRKEYMQYVTSWEEKGIVKGQAKVILKLLEDRFGPVPLELETQIRGLSEAQLDNLTANFLRFEKADDLRTWLNQQPNNN